MSSFFLVFSGNFHGPDFRLPTELQDRHQPRSAARFAGGPELQKSVPRLKRGVFHTELDARRKKAGSILKQSHKCSVRKYLGLKTLEKQVAK